MFLSRLLACGLAASCVFCVGAKADNIVQNPDFGPANSGLGYGAVSGWTQVAYPSTLAGYPYLTGSNSAGGEFFDNGTAPASTVGFIQVYPGALTDSLTQTLALTVGDEYSFSFYDNARAATADPTLTVTVGGTTLAGPTTIAPVGGSNGFYLVDGTFVATSASELLDFSVTGTGDATALLTDVNVSAVTPEPSSWLLMATGLGVLGFVYRKRFAAI